MIAGSIYVLAQIYRAHRTRPRVFVFPLGEDADGRGLDAALEWPYGVHDQASFDLFMKQLMVLKPGFIDEHTTDHRQVEHHGKPLDTDPTHLTLVERWVPGRHKGERPHIVQTPEPVEVDDLDEETRNTIMRSGRQPGFTVDYRKGQPQ